MFDALYTLCLMLSICISVCCLQYFLISTLYNFLLLTPTYCGSDISGTNQYLAPLSSLAGMCAAAGLQWASCQLLQDQLLLPRSQRQESSSRLGADVLVHQHKIQHILPSNLPLNLPFFSKIIITNLKLLKLGLTSWPLICCD